MIHHNVTLSKHEKNIPTTEWFFVILRWYVFSPLYHCSTCVCVFSGSPWIGRYFWVQHIFYILSDLLMIYLWFWSFEDGQFGKINTFLTNTFILWLFISSSEDIFVIFWSVDALTVANIYRLTVSYLSIYSQFVMWWKPLFLSLTHWWRDKHYALESEQI